MTSVPKICSVEGCERENLAKMYCALHYQRIRKFGSLTVPEGHSARKRTHRGCRITACEREAVCYDLCRKHLMRLIKKNDPEAYVKERENYGMSKTREYSIWDGIKGRCFRKNNNKYKYYGGRGIGIAERWLKFSNFYADMGKCPSGMTIDRIDVDGNYEPGNCRWATKCQQSYNRRLQSNNKSGYRGVSWYREEGKWGAEIGFGRHTFNLGKYVDIEQAALAYDCAAIQLYGDDAKLNIIE